jgi:hypothetical protein
MKTRIMMLALVVTGFGIASSADAGWGIKDLDPFNKNSGVRKSGRKFDKNRLKVTDRALRGGRYTVKLVNRTRNVVFYNLNGRNQIGLFPGRAVTVRGTGKLTIKFTLGLRDRSTFTYNLRSGKTYSFVRQNKTYPKSGRVNILNLTQSR